MSLVRSGTFGYRIGAATTTLGPGAVMLGNAGVAYECSHEHSDGDHCLAISFAPEVIAEVSRAAGVRNVEAPFRLPALPPLAPTDGFAHAVDAARRGSIDWSVEEVALELAAWALHAETGATRVPAFPTPSARDRARSADAMLYLDAHADEPLTLTDVARRTGTSPFHFLRSFRATVGVTPHQYLVRRRLAQAAAMLLDTTAPVTTIAYDSGFRDLAHFIRSFGRAFGCSPRTYRRAGGLPMARARNAKSPRPPRG